MPKTVNCNINAQVSNGSIVSDNKKMDVEILFDGDIVVPKAGGKKRVPANTDDASNELQLIVIKSDIYDPQITFTLHSAAADSASDRMIVLDNPLMLIGSGVIKALMPSSGTPPKTPLDNIEFINGSTNDAPIKILICRNASV